MRYSAVDSDFAQALMRALATGQQERAAGMGALAQGLGSGLGMGMGALARNGVQAMRLRDAKTDLLSEYDQQIEELKRERSEYGSPTGDNRADLDGFLRERGPMVESLGAKAYGLGMAARDRDLRSLERQRQKMQDADRVNVFNVRPSARALGEGAEMLGGSRKAAQERENLYRAQLAEVQRQRAEAAKVALEHSRKLQLKGFDASDDPSSVQEWRFFQGLSPEDKQQYLLMKRAGQYVNTGDAIIQPDPLRPGASLGRYAVKPKPETKIEGQRVVSVGSDGAIGVQDLPETRKEREARANLERAVRKDTGRVIDEVGYARTLVKRGAGGALDQFAANLPFTSDTKKLANSLKTIKANLGFDKLQRMRNASPTGGALGGVSGSEMDLLLNAMANLDISQDEQSLLRSLDIIEQYYTDELANILQQPDDLSGEYE